MWCTPLSVESRLRFVQQRWDKATLNALQVVERAIAIVGKAEYERLTEGMETVTKAARVDFALKELRKLSTPNGMPDYNDPFVALFYSLWFLPSQINLACGVIDGSLHLGSDLRLIDFGCGSGAMAIGLVLVAGARGPNEFPHSIRVHGVDCPSMLKLNGAIWREISASAKREKDERLALGLRRVVTTRFESVNGLLQEEAGWLRDHRNVALSALHVAYGANLLAVKREIQALWNAASPIWGAITTANFGTKPAYARQIAPWSMPTQVTVSQPFSGELSDITTLRREIRQSLPMDSTFDSGALLWTPVRWNLDSSPFVLRYPPGRGGAP